MKSTHISITLFIFSAIVASGCKKERKTITNPPATKTYLVTKITERTNLDTTHYVKFEFTYDDKNRITQMTLPPDSYFGLGDTGPSMIYNYTYDSAGNLSTVTSYQNTLYVATTTYTYSADSIYVSYGNPAKVAAAYAIKNNRITEENYETDRGYTTYNYDSNGNVSAFTYVHADGTAQPTVNFTYDQKKNPFSMIGGNNPPIIYFFILGENAILYPGSPNGYSNINNLTANPEGLSEIASSSGTTISYLYNSDGFPAFAAVESDTGSNNIFLTYTYLVK